MSGRFAGGRAGLQRHQENGCNADQHASPRCGPGGESGFHAVLCSCCCRVGPPSGRPRPGTAVPGMMPPTAAAAQTIQPQNRLKARTSAGGSHVDQAQLAAQRFDPALSEAARTTRSCNRTTYARSIPNCSHILRQVGRPGTGELRASGSQGAVRNNRAEGSADD